MLLKNKRNQKYPKYKFKSQILSKNGMNTNKKFVTIFLVEN
jgi:hypothetical protein